MSETLTLSRASAQIIAKAKVPIIKFEDTQSGVNFDISFDAANGPEAAEYVRALMQKLPPMRPLVLILKVFLHQRELNEVRQLQSSIANSPLTTPCNVVRPWNVQGC